ncbi:hypothetical protein MFAL_01220 [Mycolicibacterium fallax]|nr:hypothetical protein MFAL_01220 [Mycolicibacterium fallax]
MITLSAANPRADQAISSPVDVSGITFSGKSVVELAISYTVTDCLGQEDRGTGRGAVAQARPGTDGSALEGPAIGD